MTEPEPQTTDDAIRRLGQWFAQMLQELEEDRVDDAKAINDLRGKVASVFADWKTETGYGAGGSGTGTGFPEE